MAARQQVSVFRTIFDFGGRRLALSDQAGILVAAAYIRYGIAGYSMHTGKLLWQRRDLKGGQKLSLSAGGQRVYCELKIGPLIVLDVHTGETVDRLRAVEGVTDSQWEPVSLYDNNDAPELVSGDGTLHIKLARDRIPRRNFLPAIPIEIAERLALKERPYMVPQSFTLLHATFAPGKVFTSETGGCVRCFTTTDLAYLRAGELWRYTPHSGSHVLRLAYRPADDCLVGVEWCFEKGGPSTLLTWDIHSGKVVQMLPVGKYHDCDFCQAGQVLVGRNRTMISTFDGAAVGSLGDLHPPSSVTEPEA